MTFLNSLGNFQADVGKFDANMGVISAYIFAAFLIIIAIIFTVLALEKTKSADCVEKSKNPENCEEKRRYEYLWALILIPIAIAIVYFSKMWKNFVYKNKTAAQIGGTMFEYNTVKQLFS